MRRAFCVLACLVGCSDDPGTNPEDETATYLVSWTLAQTGAPAAPTCESHRLTDIKVIAEDLDTGDQVSVTTPCSGTMIETPEMRVGMHEITIQAIGEFGDFAGDAKTTGTLKAGGDPVTIGTQAIEVISPATQMLSLWSFASGGSNATCAEVGAVNVEVTSTPMDGAPQVDTWPCGGGAQPIDLPYTAFQVSARVLGAGDVQLGPPLSQSVTPQRGEVAISFSFELPRI